MGSQMVLSRWGAASRKAWKRHYPAQGLDPLTTQQACFQEELDASGHCCLNLFHMDAHPSSPAHWAAFWCGLPLGRGHTGQRTCVSGPSDRGFMARPQAGNLLCTCSLVQSWKQDLEWHGHYTRGTPAYEASWQRASWSPPSLVPPPLLEPKTQEYL